MYLRHLSYVCSKNGVVNLAWYTKNGYQKYYNWVVHRSRGNEQNSAHILQREKLVLHTSSECVDIWKSF